MKIKSRNAAGEISGRTSQQSLEANTTERTQTFEEATTSTLDAICKSSEETYDKFMKGFVYLNPANVKNVQVEDEGPPAEFLAFQQKLKSKVKPQSHPAAGANNFLPEMEEFTLNDSKTLSPTTDRPAEENVLEEEVLGAGTTTKPYLMRSDVTSKSLKVKVGNFMDEESGESEEEEGTYSPSFSSGQAFATSSDDKKTGNEKEKSLKEMNIGENSQEETECRCNLSGKDRKENHSGNTSSIESTINRQNKPDLSVNHGETLAEKTVSVNIEDNGSKPELSVTNEENQLDPVVGDVKNTRQAQAIESDDLLELVGEYNSDVDDSDLVYDPSKDMPNFGEVEDEYLATNKNTKADVQKLTTETLLEFKVVKCSSENEKAEQAEENEATSDRNPTSVHQQQEGEASCNDRVEPFGLEAGFDYDNVVLTPKYSAEDMAIMRSAAKTK